MKFAHQWKVVGLLAVWWVAAGGQTARAQAATDQTILPPTTPPNQISVAAKVPTAYAAAGAPGSFVVTRSSENVLGDVTVSYRVSGRAEAGREYRALRGTRTIREGETRATIKVHPLAVAGSGGTVSSVRVTLLEGSGYSLTAAKQAKVKIVQ